MRFVNKDNVYLKIYFDIFGDVSSRASAAVQMLMNPLRAASPQPDFLEFAAGSDVSILVK